MDDEERQGCTEAVAALISAISASSTAATTPSAAPCAPQCVQRRSFFGCSFCLASVGLLSCLCLRLAVSTSTRHSTVSSDDSDAAH